MREGGEGRRGEGGVGSWEKKEVEKIRWRGREDGGWRKRGGGWEERKE